MTTAGMVSLIGILVAPLLSIAGQVDSGDGSSKGAQHAVGRSRAEFAQAISKLKEGTPEADVVALLGRPDDIRTQHDPGGISTVGTKEIWRYGTSGHLTTATLGQVYIDAKGRVQYVYGKGIPLTEKLPEERELRRLLQVLDRVPSYRSGYSYNPRHVIHAVNSLQPLGKERALAVIDEFLRVTSDFHDQGREGVFLVLRTLFDVPADPGYFPGMMVGAPTVSAPKNKKLLPRFPVALEGDIPFLLVQGYTLAGVAEPPEMHIEHFRKEGRVRAKPLAPTDKPFEAVDSFARSPRWIFTDREGLNDDERGRHFLGEQVLRLADSVYRVEPERYGYLLPWGDQGAARRHQIIQEASQLRIRWEPARHQYTFLDGKSLPEPVKKHYRREIWKPGVAGLQVTLERQNARYVGVGLQESFHAGRSSPRGVVKLFKVNSRDKPLAELRVGPDRSGDGTAAQGSSWTSTILDVPEGTQIQVESLLDGRSKKSPVFNP